MLAITFLAFGIRLFHLTYRSLWTDEFHTLAPIQMSLADMLQERIRAGHLPTYFLMMKGWSHFAGTSDWALRFPSAVIGTLLIPCSVLFSRRFLSKPFVFAIAGVAACNGLAVWSSQEARMYAALCVTGTLAHYYYLKTLLEPRARTWVAYFFWLLLAITIQPLMLVHFIGHLVFSVCIRSEFPRHARVVKRMMQILPFIVLPAVVAYLATQQKASARFDVQNPLAIGRQLVKLTFGNTDQFPWYRAGCVVVGLVLAYGIVREWRRRAPDALVPPVMARFCAAVVLTPLIALWTAEWFVPSVFGQEKYYVPALVPVWVLAIWGVWSYRNMARVALALASGLLVLLGLVGQWSDDGQGGRELSRHLARHASPTDVVVMRTSGGARVMLAHYGAGHINLRQLPDKLPREELLARLREVTTGYSRMWLVTYRGENRKALPELVAAHPEEFQVLERVAIDRSASLTLLHLNLGDRETTGTE